MFRIFLPPCGNSRHKWYRMLKSGLLIPVLNWTSISQPFLCVWCGCRRLHYSPWSRQQLLFIFANRWWWTSSILSFPPEAFDGGVLVAVSLSVHGLFHSERIHPFPDFTSAVLVSPIWVMNEAWIKPPPLSAKCSCSLFGRYVSLVSLRAIWISIPNRASAWKKSGWDFFIKA
jgi:hypothetical protein